MMHCWNLDHLPKDQSKKKKKEREKEEERNIYRFIKREQINNLLTVLLHQTAIDYMHPHSVTSFTCKLHVNTLWLSPVAELLWYLQRHSSLATHAPSWRTESPGQPQVRLHSGESRHTVSPWRSEHERGQGFPQGHSSWPPPQSAEGSSDVHILTNITEHYAAYLSK